LIFNEPSVCRTDAGRKKEDLKMNINGIGTSGYFNSWEKRKTQRNHTDSDFERRMAAGRQDTKTTSEIIVRPDGSRVLMITVDIGGTQAAMSLQISEPTVLQNDISKQENDGSKEPVNAATFLSDKISGSAGEE